jgi:hypothetical protein
MGRMSTGSTTRRRWYQFHRTFAPTNLLILAFFVGCGQRTGVKVEDGNAEQGAANETPAEVNSASSLLDPSDYNTFRPGRPKADVLNDVQWRGNFEFASEIDEQRVEAISYGLLGGPLSERGTSILAIFIDDKFEKFVPWPTGDAKIKIGDFGILARAVESKSVAASDLEKEAAARPATRTHVDPGLTALWHRHQGKIKAARAPALKRNVELRDQFNAARLELGMTVEDVESVIKSKPFQSGKVHAGDLRIYGTAESLDIPNDLHYSNILVLFRDNKVIGIYSGGLVPGGDGLQKMRSWFVDLPGNL